MRLTRDEIILVGALISALVVGEFVKRYRIAHPEPVTPAHTVSKNNPRAKSTR